MTAKFGNWSKEQILQVKEIAVENGLEIVMVPKDWVNGARGNTNGIGKLFLAKKKLIYKIMSKYDIPDKKKLAYSTLVLGENVKFKLPNERKRIRVTLIPGSSYGRAYMTSELSDLNDLGGICKLGGASKDIVFTNDKLCSEMKADLVVYEDGNKLNLSKIRFANAVGHKPGCHPLVKFNKNDPTFRWGLLAAQEDKIIPDLFEEKVIVESGTISLDDALKKLGYPSESGPKLRMALRPLTIGMNIFTSDIAAKAISTAIKKKIFKQVFGIIGTLCDITELPDELPILKGIGMRPPNQRLIKCVVKIDYDRGLIGVQNDIIHDVGGDLDGDLFMFIEECNAQDMWSIDTDKHPMMYPEKKETKEQDMDIFDIWCETVNAVTKVGRVHNDSVVILTTAIHNGIREKEKISLINDITFYDETYIHSFKHGTNENVPGLLERLEKSKYCDMMAACEREQIFSRVMRRGTILDWIRIAKEENARYDAPFFEKLCSMFKHWKPCTTQNNEHLLEEMEPIRTRSYRWLMGWTDKFGNFNERELGKRWIRINKMLQKKYDTLYCPTIMIMFILQCYRKRDWQIANYGWERWYKWKTKEKNNEC